MNVYQELRETTLSGGCSTGKYWGLYQRIFQQSLGGREEIYDQDIFKVLVEKSSSLQNNGKCPC